MSTAVRSALSRSVRRIEWHTYITSPHRRRTCQVAYTICKDVQSFTDVLIGTARWDRVGSAPPTTPRQPVVLVLSRHGRTDVMAMKDALGGWIGGGSMHAQRWTPARWVAVPQCQPTNADSRCGHYRTTLTTGAAGLPTPLHGPHCRTPVPGPSPVTA